MNITNIVLKSKRRHILTGCRKTKKWKINLKHTRQLSLHDEIIYREYTGFNNTSLLKNTGEHLHEI
jgi:hypothetical protein